MPLRDSGISAQQPVGLSCTHFSSSSSTVFPFHNSSLLSFHLPPCPLIHLLLSPLLFHPSLSSLSPPPPPPPPSPSFYSFLPRLRSLPGVVHGTGSGSLSLKQGFMISFLISLASLPCQCHQLLVCALHDLLDPGHPLVQPVDNGHLGDELGKQS